MNILSFQSAVAFGHVGNSAAILPLQRLGFEAWPVHTVQFSNHPGYGPWGGATTPPATIAAILDGLDRIGALSQCGAVLSGYLGEAASGPLLLGALSRMAPGTPYLCDPVMGDDGALYVTDGIPDFMRDQAVPAASILTPNRFELELLSGLPVRDLAEAVTAARALLARGPRLVAVTSLEDGATCLAVTGEGAWAIRTPLLPACVKGGGDLLAALLLAHSLRGEAAPEALSLAVSSLYGVLDRTVALGRRELALVQAQDEIVLPSRLFAPEAV